MAELDTIDVELKDLKIVKSIFARHLPYKQVWAYGSRVKWTAGHTSDLDCVVFGATDSEIANAKEAFDESDIPFEVQLLNWETIPDDFRENIMEQYFVLQSKRDWKETTLGEISEDIAYGYTASAKQEPIGSKFLRITDVTNGRLDWKLVPYCEISDSNSKKYQLKTGDIVIARTGATTGATYTMKPRDPSNVVFASYLVRYRIDKSLADPFFIDFCLSSSFWKSYVASIAGGSAQPGANAKQLASFKISIPPLPEQKAITSVLSSLDDKIDLLHRQNKTLESIAETLFRQWFIEGVQDDWEEGQLGDFIVPKKGKNITKSQAIDGQYPVIAGGLNPSCYHNQCNTSAPVITISASGANAGFVNLHYIPVWSSDSSFIDSATTNDVYFFYMFLKYFQEGIYDKQEGSAQPHIYPGHLINLDILKYPLVLIENYEINVTPFFDKIAKNQKQIKTLESLRDTLLPKLISGNIRVKYEGAA